MSGWLLSVVVIGRNEGERLRRCLESVGAMRRGAWDVELIYVDSGSSDGSVALAQQMGARTIALTPVRPTAALGRNAGWRAARGEWVLFLDGDTVLAPDFAAEALPEFADTRVAVVWGHRREMFPEQTVYNRVLDLDWVYAPGYAAFCGGDALFRRDVLEATGGFDETLIAGEEPELCRRILAAGGLISHVDRAMTLHDLEMRSFGQYWQRAMRAGHAYAEVSDRFASDGFWSAEVRRNRVRAFALCGVVVAGVVGSIALRSVWPMGVAVGGLLALAVRTAWKARWKSRDGLTLLLYGVHSHLQQVPIFVGQMRYWWNRRRGVRAGLVEYKRP
jgi:cellulose synthase/poly-beta-1,6-N-acetylglucosamine synthase-like glycosyltransferase